MSLKVKISINNFINKTYTNKDGVVFPTVPNNNKKLVSEFLNNFYKAFETLFTDKHEAERIFISALEKVKFVRLDDKDKNLHPLKGVYDEMQKTCQGRRLDGGITYLGDDFVAVVDMDYNLLSNEEAMQTLVHEFVHAMTIREKVHDGTKKLVLGVQTPIEKNEIMTALNEGLTEIIAKQIYQKMYNKPVKHVNRYGFYQMCVNQLFDLLGDRNELIEDYLVDADLFKERLKKQENDKNENMLDYIKSLKINDIKNNPEISKNLHEFKFKKQDNFTI